MNDIESRISIYGKAQLAYAASEERKAEAARREAADLLRFFDASATADLRRQQEILERQAQDHDRRAQVARRQSEFAQRGYLLVTPDTAGIPDGIDQDLLQAARQAGLWWTTTETVAAIDVPAATT